MNKRLVNLPQTRPLIARRNRINKQLPKKVAILYSEVKRKYFPTYEQYLTEKDAQMEAESLVPYLRHLGIRTVLLPADTRLAGRLRRHRPNLVMNFVCSVRGCEYLSATVPAMLELLEIPYTGVNMLGFNLCMNKYMTKDLLQRHGIPVPRFQLFTSWRGRLGPPMPLPGIF